MPGDPNPTATRLDPASPAAGRRRPALPAWVGVWALAVALASSACDGGGSSSDPADRGSSDAAADVSDASLDASPDAQPDAQLDAQPDAEQPDAQPDAAQPDAAQPDAAQPDAQPDAAPPRAIPPTVTAGGASVESSRYRVRLSVGGPAPMHVTSSDRLQARIGVALPLPGTEERSR